MKLSYIFILFFSILTWFFPGVHHSMSETRYRAEYHITQGYIHTRSVFMTTSHRYLQFVTTLYFDSSSIFNVLHSCQLEEWITNHYSFLLYGILLLWITISRTTCYQINTDYTGTSALWHERRKYSKYNKFRLIILWYRIL